MMILHGYWRSSASYRVRIALGLKGLEVEHRAVNLKTGEQLGKDHAALNVQPLVPVLELEDGTKLTQSLAIMDFLEEAFPTPALLPNDAGLRAQIRAAAHIIATDIAPIQNLRVLKFIRTEYGQDDEGVKRWASHWIREGFKSLEILANSNDHQYLLTDEPGYFECCLIPQIYNAQRFGIDMSAFPGLSAINEAVRELPAFLNASPKKQHDAPG